MLATKAVSTRLFPFYHSWLRERNRPRPSRFAPIGTSASFKGRISGFFCTTGANSKGYDGADLSVCSKGGQHRPASK